MAMPPIPPGIPLSLSSLLIPTKVIQPATLRHATNRVCIPNARSGSNTQAGGRCWQVSFVPINGTVRIGFWNGAILTGGAGETGNGDTMVLRASITQVNGTRTATYTSATVANNAIGYVDIPGVVNAANRPFIIHWDMQMGAAGFVPSMSFSNCCDRGNGDQYQVGAGGFGHTQDNTVLGTGETSNWLPQYVSAMSDRNVWVAITDSLGETSDITFDPSGGRGLFGRAMAEWGPHLNYAAPGDRANVAATGFTARAALITAAGASTTVPFPAIYNLARNDITNGRTVPQILSDSSTVYGLMKAAGIGTVITTTTTMYTTSTDNGNTTANQTVQSVANELVRCTLNDFKRGAAPYSTTGTLTNGSAVISAVANLTLFGFFPGMVMSSSTGGITGGTTISSIDFTNNTITMSAAFTGTTTPGASITGTQPAVSGQTITAVADGLVDICAPLECAKSGPLAVIRNGGVWFPGLVNLDGLHCNSNGDLTVKPLLTGLMATRC